MNRDRQRYKERVKKKYGIYIRLYKIKTTTTTTIR